MGLTRAGFYSTVTKEIICFLIKYAYNNVEMIEIKTIYVIYFSQFFDTDETLIKLKYLICLA